MRLGFESKGEFQAAYFNSIIEAFLQGRNHNDENTIESEITSIITGLSRAWDAAEEYSPKS
jgi:hypothetical protein